MLFASIESVFKKQGWLIVALPISLLLSFTPLRAVSYVVVLLAIARLLPLQKLGGITRFTVAFVLVSSLNGFIAAVFWLIKQPLSSALLLSLYIVPLFFWLKRNKDSGAKANTLILDGQDLVASVAALAVAALLCWPIFFTKASGVKLAQIVTAGGDNVAHLEMVKTNDLNKGIAYGFSRNRVNPSAGTSNYPQTWHFNTALNKWLIEPLVKISDSPQKIMAVFYGSAVLWFAMFIFMLVRLSISLAGEIAGKFNWLAGIGALAVTGPVFVHWLVSLFTNGFHAQNAALLLLLVEALLLIVAQRLSARERFPLLVLAGICVASINFVWLFLFPIAALPLLVFVAETWRQNNNRLPLFFVSSGVILALFSIFQPLMYKAYPLNFGLPWLLQRGFILQTSMYTLIFMSILAFWYIYANWQNKQLRVIALFLLAALVFSLGLFKYHLSQLGELRYFYFKSTYTVIVFVSVVLGAAACKYLLTLFKQKNLAQKIISVVATIALSTMASWSLRIPLIDSYLNSSIGGITQAQANELMNQLKNDSSNGLRIGFMGACNRGDDIRASQLAHALAFINPTDVTSASSFDAEPHEEKKLFGYIADVASRSKDPLVVISSDQVLSQKLLTYLGAQANIRLINIDTTPETEPVKQCPDRARDLTKFPIQ